jgi:protoheme IX farnesyltransferase
VWHRIQAVLVGELEVFAILFLWQIPHSLAIARLHRDDYARAGIRFLPVVDSDDRISGHAIVSNCLGLLIVGLLPALIGMAGPTYFFAALALGVWFLAFGIEAAFASSANAARRLLLASLIYLPSVLVLLALDKPR